MTGSEREFREAGESAWRIFAVFLRLGVTSFGGPVAHLGYFREEFVRRRRWLSDHAYAELLALCQFLPGPASSQLGFTLGLLRGGARGALAAFAGFTLPSVALMLALALSASLLDGPIAQGALAGLKLVAVAVVALAVWGMARSLTPDAPRILLAGSAAAAAFFLPGAAGQVIAIAAGAAIGALVFRRAADSTRAFPAVPVARTAGVLFLALFAVLLLAFPLLVALLPQGSSAHGSLALADVMYRAGALVFGGGHVVLPLLDAGLVQPGWISTNEFLIGYGAAQAVPGPLFTFSSYLGAVAHVGPGGILGGLIATVAIFSPGFLLVLGVLPFWERWQSAPAARAAMTGANAAVVGILAAALYDPVMTSAITGFASGLVALACLILLAVFRMPAWGVVLVGAAAGVAMELAGLQ